MILHSPIFSGSISQAESAYANLSGSFTGSFKGVGDFEGLVADSIDYVNIFNVPTLVSGSEQISYPDISNIPSGIISSSAQLSEIFLDTLGDGVISGSSQVEFNEINSNPFSQSASSVTVSKNIVPTTNSITLGTAQNPFQDLYLSSASLYIDGTQVISSNTTELIITTDENQSLKLVETGADTITLQTGNGDITLTTTGTGNIELDAPIQIAAGNQIISSDGNAIQIGEDISVTGDIAVTGTVDGVDLGVFKTDFDAFKLKSFVTGSPQVIDILSSLNTYTGSNDTINTAQNARLTSLETKTGSLDGDVDGINSRLSQLEVETGSIALEQSTQDGRLTQLETKTGSIDNKDSQQDGRLDNLEGFTSSIQTAISVSGANVSILGNLDVAGTTTTVDSTTVQIGDNIIELNGSGAANGGLYVKDATAPNTATGSLLWDSTNDYWKAGTVGSEVQLVTISGTQTLTNKTIDGSQLVNSSVANAKLENSSITINGTSVSLGGTRTLVTDDIAEDGSPTNLWFTNTRARAAVSVTDNGGDGSLSYNSTSGVITYTGPSASEVRAHFSSGTGVSISSGQISIGQAVGTGDTVQFAKVGVGGSSDATYELKVTGDIGATGDIVAYVSSDERLKNNVELISNPIEKVQALRGVTWEWNELASEAAKQSPNVGVIAQEVEQVLPQLVHDRENGFKGVDYAKLTGLLIEAIKEQQKQIDELKSKLG